MAASRDLGMVQWVRPEALGQPGQRRFRLAALSQGGEYGAIWLEKEQMSALAEALRKVLADEGYEHRETPPPDDRLEPPVFPLDADVDLRAVQLSMGINQGDRRIVLLASDNADPNADEATTVRFEFDYASGYQLREEIASVVAAGRPVCPLCSAPMNPEGHVCVRSNGHHPD